MSHPPVRWLEGLAREALPLLGLAGEQPLVFGEAWPLAKRPGGTGEPVVSAGYLSVSTDRASAFAEVVASVAAGGSLLLIEAGVPPGLAGRLLGSLAGPVQRLVGCHGEAALAPRLRAAGFVILSVERFTMVTHCFPRTVVRIRALKEPIR